MINCLIIDDEPLAIRVILNHLENFKEFKVRGTCTNATEAFDILSSQQIDLIFLDINMPKMNGLEFVKTLEKPPYIIITTAYREFAVESYELNVMDYLVKPISLERFMKALQKVSHIFSLKKGADLYKKSNTVETSQDSYIFVKVNKKMVKINFDDILYVESLKDYVSIKTVSKDYVTHYNLLAITTLLPENLFLRIHRSYTIALNKVEAIDGNRIQIKDKMLPIGRNYVKDVKEKILKGT